MRAEVIDVQLILLRHVKGDPADQLFTDGLCFGKGVFGVIRLL